MSCCYCLHYTHQYMLSIVAIVGCTLHRSIHAMYYYYCWLYTPPSIHAMYCCYCWLYTTHINTCYVLLLLLAVHYTHQYMLCIVAIVGCTLHTSIHAMYCCYCWLYTTHINTCHVLLLLLTTLIYGQLQLPLRTC